jgi:hypothetical protein
MTDTFIGTVFYLGKVIASMAKAERVWQLQRLADTHDGCEIIRDLWNRIKVIPPGSGVVGILVRQEMIPDILAHEYPDS